MGWSAVQLPDMSGRTAVVTGANSGIGWHTARELAAHGARVVLACRDVERAKLAADRIRAAAAGSDVAVAELDLASADSIREFGSVWSERLDLLINNAGVMAPPARASTRDGFELQFGTNHLGHFVLTGLLLPALLTAPAPRVVTVSSLAHNGGTEAVLDANAAQGYVPRRAYANSKLANVLFALELQRQSDALGLPLTSVAAHPGLAATGLVSDREGMGAVLAMRYVASAAFKLIAQPAAAGARAILFAASAAAPGSFTGPTRFGGTRGPIGPAPMSALAQDEKLAHRLWTASEELTGFVYPWP